MRESMKSDHKQRWRTTKVHSINTTGRVGTQRAAWAAAAAPLLLAVTHGCHRAGNLATIAGAASGPRAGPGRRPAQRVWRCSRRRQGVAQVRGLQRGRLLQADAAVACTRTGAP